MSRVLGLLKVFRRDIIVMIIAAFNKKTPSKVRAIIFLACLYILSPVDIFPDTVPFVGLVDDMLIIPAVVYGIRHMLPQSVEGASESEADAVIRRGGLILGISVLVIIFWISLIFFALYKLFF